MATQERTIDVETLLAQSTWLRRLATALVSDPATAEDLAQETWMVALRAPPRAEETVRIWLRRVFTNRLRDTARARRRREAREQAATEEPAGVETPEELAARMELHRRLASHLASLDEPIRQVLFLRFVEGLEPIEIARRLGIPDGTVRWRLKRGLDELRARLDADAGGDRRGWVLLLLPLVPRRCGTCSTTRVPGSRHWSSWGSAVARRAAFGALAGAIGLVAAYRGCNARSPRDSEPGASQLIRSEELDRAAERFAAQSQWPHPTPVAPQPPAPSACPEAQALEKERDALAAAAEPFRKQRALFEQSPPNPEAQDRIGPIVDEMFSRTGKCGHALECRGSVCRIAFLMPQPAGTDPPMPEACYEREAMRSLREYVMFGTSREDDGTAFDPVSRAWLSKFNLYVRLASRSGDPVPLDQRKPPPELPAGWDRERGPLPKGLKRECQAWTARVRAEIDLLEQPRPGVQPPEAAFVNSM